MSNEVQSPSHVVVVSATKSMGISILLTFLFGPLGMLYSTIPGAIVMVILSVIIGVLTFGFGFLLTWPICIIWGAVATSSYNKKLLARAMLPTASPMAQEPAPQRSEPSDLGFDADAEQKRCPACAEQIKLEALKCKHCGELLDPAVVRTEIEQRKIAFAQRKTARLTLLEGVGRPAPELATHLEAEAEATAIVAEPRAEGSGAKKIPTSRPPSQPYQSPTESPRAVEPARNPWIIGGAAVVLIALASWAWIHLVHPRNAPTRVTTAQTQASPTNSIPSKSRPGGQDGPRADSTMTGLSQKQPASSSKNGSQAGPNATVLVIAPQKESGGPGQLTFSNNNNTLFFFDKPSQKGLVIINNAKYDLTTCSSEGSSSVGSYKLSGEGIVITAPNCKYGDEGGDCFHGNCQAIVVSLDGKTTTISNVGVMDCLSFSLD